MRLEFRKVQIVLLMGDLLVVLCGYQLAYWLRFSIEERRVTQMFDAQRHFTGAWLIVIFTTILALYLSELYKTYVIKNAYRTTARILLAVAGAAVVEAVVFYWLPAYRIYRKTQLYQIGIILLLLFFWRVFLFKRSYLRWPRQKVILVGTPSCDTLAPQIINSSIRDYFELIGYVANDPEKDNELVSDLPKLGEIRDLPTLCREADNPSILVVGNDPTNTEMFRVLLDCKMAGAEVIDAIWLYRKILRKVPVQHVGDRWFVFGPSIPLTTHPGSIILRRAFDIVASFAISLITSPIILCISIILHFDSKGTVFYGQERSGQHLSPFTLYKFRTMIAGAESSTGPVWAQKNDTRVTRLGAFMRQTRIDELPQLWNVFRGDISLIGPRPERPFFVEQLMKSLPYYSIRFLVKPGLTGWAQVNFGYGGTEKDALEKLRYDLYYVQNASILLDLQIIFRTIQTILFHRAR
jgi:exopolysaccharide biosynthesis polyprenyl glycosylphosphotransferase